MTTVPDSAINQYTQGFDRLRKIGRALSGQLKRGGSGRETFDFLPLGEVDGVLDASTVRYLRQFTEANELFSHIGRHAVDSHEFDLFERNSLGKSIYDQIFSPTTLTAVPLIVEAGKQLGAQAIVDLGSGDGRFPYVGERLGMDSVGIEIDKRLVESVSKTRESTDSKFNLIHGDVKEFDYSKLNPKSLVVFYVASQSRRYLNGTLRRIHETSPDLFFNGVFFLSSIPTGLNNISVAERIATVRVPVYVGPSRGTRFTYMRFVPRS